MDEVTLFTTIAPPPPSNADAIRQGARIRLAAAISSPPRPAQRHRRPLILAGAAAAAVAAAASVLLLAIGSPFGGQARAAVHVNLAAWSVNTNRDGTVTFKVKKLADPTRLEHVLAQAGVPAIVRFGENCRAQGHTLPVRGIVSGPAYVGGAVGRPQWIDGRPYPAWAYTITPSAMPSGSTFMISVGPGPDPSNPMNFAWFDWAIVPAGTHVTCGPSVPPVVG
jgi:hypothetical protein